MVSLLIGVIYYGQQLDQDGVMNINGALFIFLTNMTFQNVFAVISVSIFFLLQYITNNYKVILIKKKIGIYYRYFVLNFRFFYVNIVMECIVQIFILFVKL